MKSYFNKILLIFVTCFSLLVKAQDPQFSQFYSASLYLNPAFTGNTDVGRFSGIYRNQWASIPGAFNSYSFAYDHNLIDLNSGIGLMVTHDKAGSGGLKFTNVAGLYSYSFAINRKLFIKAGMKFSYTFRGLNKSELLFADQIIRDGADETIETFSDQGISYFDAGTGALLFSEKFWVGAAFDHLTKPEQSFINNESRLPIKSSFHGGYKILIENGYNEEDNSNIMLAFNYKHQLTWNQLDIGAYYNKSAFVFGMWYRGIPIIKNYSISDNDAFVLLVGVHNNGFKIGYSYDITLSKLGGNSGGSHEVSIVYEYPYKKRKKKRHAVPCAKF